MGFHTCPTNAGVEAELKRRGLEIRENNGSFHVADPDGFDVQTGGKIQEE